MQLILTKSPPELDMLSEKILLQACFIEPNQVVLPDNKHGSSCLVASETVSASVFVNQIGLLSTY